MIIVTPMVLLQAVVTYLLFDQQWKGSTMRLSRGVAANVALLVKTREFLSGPDTAQRLSELAATGRLTVAVHQGDTLPKTPSLTDEPVAVVFLGELQKEIGRPIWVDSETNADLMDIRVQLDGAVMRLVTDRKRAIATNVHIYVLWIAASAFLLLSIAIMFLRNQVRPIERLADAAEAFGKGRDIPDFRPSGATEVRRAALAFLDMRQRISRAIQQRTEMLAGVSHDLRTPITRMKLQLAMMPDSPDVSELKADTIEMERMVEEYLSFARGQAGEAAVEMDIGALLQDVAANARRLERNGGAGKSLELKIEPDLMLQARPNAIRRCVTNLVENALRYADRAVISAEQHAGTIEISVDDNGPGIAPERLEEAFRPFHRLDEGRNLASGGVGLGLAIARDIARGHGGDVVLGASAMGGLSAKIRLPV
jgi:two-component system osmolarity sensor histidine kinase EnvZ